MPSRHHMTFQDMERFKSLRQSPDRRSSAGLDQPVSDLRNAGIPSDDQLSAAVSRDELSQKNPQKGRNQDMTKRRLQTPKVSSTDPFMIDGDISLCLKLGIWAQVFLHPPSAFRTQTQHLAAVCPPRELASLARSGVFRARNVSKTTPKQLGATRKFEGFSELLARFGALAR